MSKREPILSVKDLNISFSSEATAFYAVKDSNFNLFPGETLGIVGESGSGKSLSMLAIMGLLPSNAQLLCEEIKYWPLDINLAQSQQHDLLSSRGSEIGMIFQEPLSSLNPVLSCGEQITETILHHQDLDKKAAQKKALAWIEKVGLKDTERIFKAFPHQLSGGQKQRVMCAIALCCEPKILIADEPTTALDVTIQKQFLDLLKRLKEELGISIVFISHDLSVIAEIADRVMVMQHGEIVESGPTQEVFKDAKHPYTKGLIACKPVIGKKYYRLPTIQDFLDKESTSKKPEVRENIKADLNAKPLVKVEDLEIRFAQKNGLLKKTTWVRAVDKISIQVLEGETLGIVGESGCGKSTLSKAIARLQLYQDGEIFFQGQPYHAFKADKRFYRKVQIIFQDPYSSLNPRLPIGEALLEAMQVHKIGERRTDRVITIQKLLEEVGLQDSDFSKYPHEFSGGQRQRVGIARALVVDPTLIICDEVVSALDVSVQAQVLNLLKDIQDRKKLTYIFITHDLSLVEYMCDRVAVMKAGQILELAAPEHIFKAPEHPYTKSLIEAIPGGF